MLTIEIHLIDSFSEWRLKAIKINVIISACQTYFFKTNRSEVEAYARELTDPIAVICRGSWL
ncbi:hypothetical protein [Paenibacillus sp. GCM10012306]|uniref:hypothetical protein n=1 Tax=Paenibacillus sp. GCM10012306 TaxID=3317342 RepID=UPI0036D294F6